MLFELSPELIIVFLFGIPAGIALTIISLGLFKKVDRPMGFWVLCISMGGWGFVCSLGGAYIEMISGGGLGLFLMVLGTLFMSLCGLMSTVASKYQAERENRRTKT